MKHYGDITKLHGYEVAPVNVVTAGSPCQDLSVAGKGAGLAGARSGLFMEYVRIIKEMRFATYGKYPNYTIWENVPGAFSSNGGEDFRAVLEELARIADPHAVIPRPAKGKWPTAGCIMGDSYSIAWRVLDAQYWGVPQRRRRIALVMDIGGHTAPKILFECDSLPGHFTPGGKAGQDAARCAGAGAGGAGAQGVGTAVLPFDTTQITSPTNRSNPQPGDPCHPLCAGAHPPSVAIPEEPITLRERGGCEGGGKGPLLQYDKSGTLTVSNDQALFEPDPARWATYDARGNGDGRVTPTLTGDHNRTVSDFTTLCVDSAPEDGEGAAAFLAKNSAKARGMGYAVEQSPTLLAKGQVPTLCLPEVARTLTARHDGSYDPGRGNGQNIITVFDDDVAGTLTTKCGGTAPLSAQMGHIVATDSPPLLCASNGQAKAEILEDLAPTLNCDHEQPYITQEETAALDCRNLTETGEQYPTLQAKDNGGISLNYSHAVRRGARVRRLTPTECERLQGYPDGWTDIPTYEKLVVIEKGPRAGDVELRVIDVTDSVRYSALGDTIALPPWLAIKYSLSRFLPRWAVMGSLFDGIGGFPLVWEWVFGKGTALWACEINPFRTAVTKHHFPE